MVNTSTPKNSIVPESDKKLSLSIQRLQKEKPSEYSINNILAYSKALKIETSELIKQIVTVNN